MPSPVKAKTGSSAVISTSTAALRAPSARASLTAFSSGTGAATTAPSSVLGEGAPSEAMLRNLEMGLHDGDEGLESDDPAEQTEGEGEILVTPKKARAQSRRGQGQGRSKGKRGAEADGEDADDAAIAVAGENEDEDGDGVSADNAETARSLGSPRKTFAHGSRYRTSMLAAGEAVERVRAQAQAGKTAPAGPAGKSKGAKKDKAAAAGAAATDTADKLNVKDKKWEGIYWETHKTMGGDETPPSECGRGDWKVACPEDGD